MSNPGETAAGLKKPKAPFVLLALSLPAVVLLKAGFLFLAIGMLPTLLAMLVSGGRRPFVVSTVAAFNFAGVFPQLLSVYLQGGNANAVTGQLMHLPIWAAMYGPALLGYGLVWVSPAVAYSFIEALYKSRMRYLEQVQKKLEEEWGGEIVAGEK